MSRSWNHTTILNTKNLSTKSLEYFVSKPFVGLAKCMPTKTFMRGVCHLHTTSKANEIVQFHLSDIGEGIKEVTLKEW